MKNLSEIEKRIEAVEGMIARSHTDQIAKEIAIALWEIAGRLAEEDEKQTQVWMHRSSPIR
jgi:hypothetical protein